MFRAILLLISIILSTGTAKAQVDITPEVDPKIIKSIDKLAGQKKVKHAFGIIDEMEPVTRENLITMNEIPAPPFGEAERAKFFSEKLLAAGADSVWIDAEGNVLALRNGTERGRTIALDAHLDTVFPEGTDVTVKIKGDTLAAPGIGDDTRGLSMLITILEAMNKAEIETNADVLIIGTVGEEGLGDLRGVKYLFREGGPQIDSWVAIDGGGVQRIVNKALGSYRYRVTFQGPGGHSWGAFGLGNPHHAAAKAIDYFVEAATEFTSGGDKTSFNIGRIGGGTSVNSIPFESWMEVDMRSVSPRRLDEIDAIFHTQMKRGLEDYNKSLKREPLLTVDIEKIGERPSGEIEASNTLVQHAMAATLYFDTEPVLSPPSSTDSNIPISKGIPAITIGRGGKGSGAHSLNEWWMNDSTGPESIKKALLIVLAEAGLSR